MKVGKRRDVAGEQISERMPLHRHDDGSRVKPLAARLDVGHAPAFHVHAGGTADSHLTFSRFDEPARRIGV